MILYLDCYAGISGDMTVAALIDLGVPLEYISSELSRLGIPENSYTLSANRTERHSISALKFDVALSNYQTHRKYSDIAAMISNSSLSDAVRSRSQSVFRRLAEAESKVHNVPIENVHFHEVGAVDSIVDIVATTIALDFLNIKEIYASPLPLGSGFVDSAHGRLPLPAPATAELMQGIPVHTGCGPGERVTPTGAAIVAALASGFGKQPPMILNKTGSGAGGKDFPDCPNIMRAFLGKPIQKTGESERVIVVD
ncbi:MAG: LarC family nickel insertion protein, partial [Desulfuromonadaceae bacterium]|nr:LarC family nickel insertion protein [Desulfuromonadaceae bacterium]